MIATIKSNQRKASVFNRSSFPPQHATKGEICMEKEKTIIRIRRGLNGIKYCACNKNGSPIWGFNKLSDIRKNWQKEIKWGHVELVRELDKTPDMETINETVKCLETILRAY